MTEQGSYNERLFSSGIRKFFHEARFLWLRKTIHQYSPRARSIVELGCYDAKTLSYLIEKPDRYLGLDANWEDGLTIAKKMWGSNKNYEFIETADPTRMDTGELFEIGICMETLEHMTADVMSQSLKTFSRVVTDRVFVTVPNEIGILFLLKYIAKALIGSPRESYTAKEIIWTTLGRTEKVKRHEHKGFNYKQLLAEASDHLQILQVTGIPFPRLPLACNPTIAILAKPLR